MIEGLSFYDLYYDDKENIYFFAHEINGLFRLNMITHKTTFLLSVIEYPLNQEDLYSSIIHIHNKLVFAPQLANDILVYDIEENSYVLYPLIIHKNIENQPKFFSACVYENKAYLFPSHYPGIVELDLRDYSIVYHDSWITEVPNITDYIRWSVSRVGEKIYAPLVDECKVMIFDINSKCVTIKAFDMVCDLNNGFSGICREDNYFWLSPMKSGTVIRWNYVTEEVEKYEIKNRNRQGNYSYVNCLKWKDWILICPANDNEFVVINFKTGNVQEFSHETIGVSNDNKINIQSLIFLIKNISEDVVFLCSRDGKYRTIQEKNGEIFFSTQQFDFCNCLSDWVKQDLRLKYPIVESEYLSVCHLIKALQRPFV